MPCSSMVELWAGNPEAMGSIRILVPCKYLSSSYSEVLPWFYFRVPTPQFFSDFIFKYLLRNSTLSLFSSIYSQFYYDFFFKYHNRTLVSCNTFSCRYFKTLSWVYFRIYTPLFYSKYIWTYTIFRRLTICQDGRAV